MLFLMLCSDIVATYIDICNERIGIISKQQQDERLSEKNVTSVQRKRSS